MNFISLIRFLATILITNSHFDVLYPAGFSWLSTGGALGNALFFLVSGYTLYLSSRRNFAEWILRRYSKIFPAVWIFFLITGALGFAVYSLTDWLLATPFWFLNAIIVFYPAFFFAVKFFEKRLWIVQIAACIPWLITFFSLPHDAYVVESDTLCLRWYSYFCIMLLGAMLAQTAGTTRCAREKSLIRETGGGYIFARASLRDDFFDGALRRL